MTYDAEDAKQTRTITLKIRVTPDEAAKIDALSATKKKSMARYIRDSALCDDNAGVTPLVRELSAVGAQVRRLAAAAHANLGRMPHNVIIELLETLKQTREAIKSVSRKMPEL